MPIRNASTERDPSDEPPTPINDAARCAGFLRRLADLIDDEFAGRLLATPPFQLPEGSADASVGHVAYKVAEVSEMLGVSAASIYRAVKVGEIQALRVGGRIVIPAVVVVRMLADASRDTARDPP